MHDPSSLRSRIVVISGSSRGLGREMALALAEAGCSLVLTASAPSAQLDATAAEAERLGADGVLGLVADVRSYAAAEAVTQAAIDRFGRVDVLVNNAGRGMRLVSERFNTEPTRFFETAPEAWDAIVQTNFNGAFYLARALVPQMVARGFGKVINISTSDQTMIREGYAPYGPSKAALEAASRIWAADLAGTGVDVNVYLPGGAADTDLLPPGPGKKGADGNLLDPAIMRRAIGWLCSDASNGVSGGRFIARLWDSRLPEAEAAEAARSPSVPKPMIM